MSKSKGLDAIRIARAQRASAAPSAEAVSGSVSETMPPRPQGGWLPIESAPKDGTEIDVWLRHFHNGVPSEGYRIPNAYYIQDGRVGVGHWEDVDGDTIEWRDEIGQQARVTHWQPLPAPPGDA